jgi:hypothetical protein
MPGSLSVLPSFQHCGSSLQALHLAVEVRGRSSSIREGVPAEPRASGLGGAPRWAIPNHRLRAKAELLAAGEKWVPVITLLQSFRVVARSHALV